MSKDPDFKDEAGARERLIDNVASFSKYLRRAAEENGAHINYERCVVRADELDALLAALSEDAKDLRIVCGQRDYLTKSNAANWARAEAAEAQLRLTGTEDAGVRALAKLRGDGWSVAVHNDYHLAGVQMTFWLFAHSGGQWVKGEGRSDGEAIAAALEQITRRT